MEGRADEDQGNIRVFTRVKPIDIGDSAVFSDDGAQIKTKSGSHEFMFDKVLGTESTQEQVFEACGKPLVEEIVKGFNCTVFAYGQTGSGKSYTIFGTPQNRGLLPRILEELFLHKSRCESREEEQTEFLFKGGMVEIYKEKIYDLFENGSDTLQLRESMKNGVFVENQTEKVFECADDALDAVEKASFNRHVAATAMNRGSSRSHTVFTLTMESRTTQGSTGILVARTAKFNIVDLAGSERQSSTKAAGERQEEANYINKSLLCLGSVISSLSALSNSEALSTKPHIKYRDSRLTFLLRESLGGNSKTHMIANINPKSLYLNETLSTLKFAQRAKLIRNRAKVNENLDMSNIIALQTEIGRLKEELAHKAATPERESNESLEQLLSHCLTVTEAARLRSDELDELVQVKNETCEKLQKNLAAQKALFKFKIEQVSQILSKQKDMVISKEVLESWKVHELELAAVIKAENPQAIEWRSKYDSLNLTNKIDVDRLSLVKSLEAMNTKLTSETKRLMEHKHELQEELENSQRVENAVVLSPVRKAKSSARMTPGRFTPSKSTMDDVESQLTIKNLKQRIMELEELVSKDPVDSTHLAKLESELSQLWTFNEQIVSERDSLKKDEHRARIAVESLTKELQVTIGSLSEQTKLEEDLESLHSSNLVLQMELNSKDLALHQLMKECESLRERLTAAETAKLELEKVDTAQEQQQIELHMEMESLNQLREAQQKTEALRVAKFKSDIIELEETVRQSEFTIESLTNKVAEYNAEAKILKSSTKEMQADKELHERESLEKEAELRSLRHQLQTLECSFEELQLEVTQDQENQRAHQRKQVALLASEKAMRIQRKARHSEQQTLLLLEQEKIRRIDVETRCIDMQEKVDELLEANAKLAGNANLKQKIRYVENLKQEIVQLRDNEAKLRNKLCDISNKSHGKENNAPP